MSALADTIKELELDETPVENVEKEETVSTEEVKETEVVKESEEPQKDDKVVEDTPKEEPKEDTPKAEPKEKPDYSSLTKEEKAEHAFRKQLQKQKSKHEAEIEELKKGWESKFEEFKASMKPKEEPKLRDNFESDDEYIRYLAEQKVKGIMAERDAETARKAEEDAKAKAEQEAYEADQAERGRKFEENVRNAFADGEQMAEFTKRVEKASANGLAEVLDKSPIVSKFVFERPEGPRVLNKLLEDRDTFIKVFKETDPIMQTIALMDLAKEAPKPTEPEQPPRVESPMPKLGKPGSHSGNSDEGSIFASDESLIKFVRKRGRRE